MRVAKWDHLKLVLIYLVVLGHAADVFTADRPAARLVFLWVYSFHMPLFLVISGLFAKKTVAERRYDRIFSYLLLYIACKLLITFAYAATGYEIKNSILETSGISWFALALFFYCLVMTRIKDLPARYLVPAAVAVGRC